MKLAAVKPQRNGGLIQKFGDIPTPLGTVENGLINNPEEVGAELGKLVEKLNLKGRKVVSSLTGQMIYARLMTLPAMSIDDLRTAALYQATNFLPISVEEVSADIQPVRYYEDSEGKMAEVFFIAARKMQVENLQNTCSIAGLKLARLEIEPFSLNTLFLPQVNDKELYGIINIGAQLTYLAIFHHKRLVFVRTFTFGSSAFYYQLDEISSGGSRLEEINIDNPDCVNLLGGLIDELTRSIDYFRLQNKDDDIESLLLTGSGSRIIGINRLFSAELNIPTQLASLEQRIVMPNNITIEEKHNLTFDYPVALGLALRGE